MNIYEKIVVEYYSEIMRYCSYILKGDVEGASDCTQEVFLVLHKKLHKLKLDDNIRLWLYRVAKREIMQYIRKNKNNDISIEELPEIEDKDSDFTKENETILDLLDNEERVLIEAYYDEKKREQLAAEYGISMSNLYIKIHRIRKKLFDILNK